MKFQKFVHLIRPGPRWCSSLASGKLYRQAHPLSQLLQPVPAASTFYVKDYMEKAKFFGTSLVLLQFFGTSFVMCAGGETDETKSKVPKRGAGHIQHFRSGPGCEWLDVDCMIQDPSNRDKEGVKIADVLHKAEGIEHQGFNFEKVRVILAQLPLDPQQRSEIFAQNKVWKEQDDLYPSYDEKKVEYTVLGGNHLVTFLKMVKLSTSTPSFTSVVLSDGESHRTSLHLSCGLFCQLLPLGRVAVLSNRRNEYANRLTQRRQGCVCTHVQGAHIRFF